MQKEHRCSWESFFGFRSRTAKRKSMKSAFEFRNWNPSWGQISRRWNPFSHFAFDCKIRDPNFTIERSPSIHSYNTRSSLQITSIYIKKSRLDIQKRVFSRVRAKIWNDIPAPKKTLQNETPVFPCCYPNLWNMMTTLKFPKLPLLWKRINRTYKSSKLTR